MCSTHTPTFADNNGLSNNLHNNLFLPGFSSSPGWLLVTRTRGAWWCHYRGHWRSGPRHLSPRPESAYKNGIVKTFTHTYIPTPPFTLLKIKIIKTLKHQNKKSKLLNSPNLMLSFPGPLLSSMVMGDAQEDWHLLLRTAPRLRPSCLGQYWQKTFVHMFNTYSNISRQQWPF